MRVFKKTWDTYFKKTLKSKLKLEQLKKTLSHFKLTLDTTSMYQHVTLCLNQTRSLISMKQAMRLTWLDFQTLRTGMPAMMELGSSSAAELTVSLAPMTKT